MNKIEYPFTVRVLSKAEGGGYLIEFPDLPGCISDGDTVEEAIHNGQDALKCWLAASKKSGKQIPKLSEQSAGRWVQRVPKTLHARLVIRSKAEGVSLNTLVTSMIAESLGKREGGHSNRV